MATFTGCILIDARSAGAHLPRQLAVVAPLCRRSPPDFSLTLVDDTGDARLPRIARRFGARLLSLPPTPLGHRLNEAIAQSSGEVLVFPAIGNAITAETLSQLAARIVAHELDASALPTLPHGLLHRLLAHVRRLPSGDGLCLSRDWFERIGGCDPELDKEAIGELVERLRACGARVKGTGH
jgi:hypothetical protein